MPKKAGRISAEGLSEFTPEEVARALRVPVDRISNVHVIPGQAHQTVGYDIEWPSSSTSIRLKNETLLRLDQMKPEIAIKMGRVLKSNDDAINALMDYFLS